VLPPPWNRSHRRIDLVRFASQPKQPSSPAPPARPHRPPRPIVWHFFVTDGDVSWAFSCAYTPQLFLDHSGSSLEAVAGGYGRARAPDPTLGRSSSDIPRCGSMLTCSAPLSSLSILPPLRCHPAFDAVPVRPRLVVSPPVPLQPSASINAHCCLTTRPLFKPDSSTSACFLLPIRLTLPSADALQPFPTPLPSRRTPHPTTVLVYRCPSLYEKNRLRR